VLQCSPTNLKDGIVEKRKDAMAKSSKSRCCKVDAVKGLPRGSLFDIGVYTFPDHAGSLFMS
jgi:hypothetical protein